MPTIEETLLALEARIAELEKQAEDKSKSVSAKNASKKKNDKEKPKRKRAVKDESDEDFNISDVPGVRGKTIKSEHAFDSDDSSNDDPDHRESGHKANVRVLRLTGAGKQNINIPNRADRTLEQLIDDIEIKKPGAKAFIEANIKAHRIAIEDGTWTENKCYQLHHYCRGAVINGQFSRHQISPTCGYCISRKGGPCRIMEDGKDCERCSNHGKLCLTYEDLSDIYKKFETTCIINQPMLEKWPLLRKWLETQTPQKLQYGFRIAEAHINDRTHDVLHALPGVRPCKIFDCADFIKGKPMPRGWISLFCDEAVVHRRNVAHINLLRFHHFLTAVEQDDTVQIQAILEGRGQVVHLCKPIAEKYCWEWTHTCFQSSDQNAVRDHYCFTARRLCVCDIPCLYNGEGGRFVLNVNPKLPEYKGWKPAPGRKGRTHYDTVELGAFKSNDGVEVVDERASAGIIKID